MASAIASDTLVDDRLARRNALVLAVAQALAGGNNTVIVATSAIAGAAMAPDPGLATLPVTAMVVGMWVGTLPVGALARRYGRRVSLQTGSLFGILSGLISCFAVIHNSFELFLVGPFCGGLYAAAHLSYRFAAADTASEAFKPKAISMVLAGGLAAAFVGAQLVIFTKDLWQPYLFAASYLAQSAVALLAAIILTFLRIPKPVYPTAKLEGGRPLGDIIRQPRFMSAVICGITSYGLMNLVMTSAPLAMVICGHSVGEATLGLQWHVAAMYAPAFFTGGLITRFGVDRIVAIGLGLIAGCAIVGAAGISIAHFWAGLILLGVGWNFSFVGATTMVTQCHRSEERNKVQAFNDFFVFGSMAVASVTSGKVLASFGWATVNTVVLALVLGAGALLLGIAMRTRAQPASSLASR